MEFTDFANEFFNDIKANNKSCIKAIEKNSELIEVNIGSDGNPKTIDKFIQNFNECLILQCEEKKFKLFETILRHSSMKYVLESFQKSSILVNACKLYSKDRNTKPMIKWLLTMDMDLCAQDEDGMTALMYAVKHNKLLSIVQYIIKNEPSSLNLIDKNGENALFHSLGQIDILNELLRTDIDINHKNNKSETVLIYCCKYDIFEPIQYLTVRKDIDVNDIDGEERTAAMYLTEKARNIELRSLNKRYCNYNYINKKNESVMSILVNKLYEPKETRKFGYFRSYITILTSLVHFNCNFDAPVDEDGNTAIMAFVIVNDFNTFYYVMSYNKNFNLSTKNKYGESASSLAVKCENKNMYLKLMMKNPTFDYEYVDPQTGNTMLMLLNISDPNYVGKILENNINVINCVNHKKENALIIAAKADNRKSLFELLQRGINVNQQDILGNTALHYAVMTKNKFYIKQLLSNQADVHIKNNEGKSPLDLDSTILSNDYSNDSDNNDIKNKKVVKFDKELEEYLYPCITNTFNGFVLDYSLIKIERDYYGELLEKINLKYEFLKCNPISGSNYKKIARTFGIGVAINEYLSGNIVH